MSFQSKDAVDRSSLSHFPPRSFFFLTWRWWCLREKVFYTSTESPGGGPHRASPGALCHGRPCQFIQSVSSELPTLILTLGALGKSQAVVAVCQGPY